MKYTTDLLEAVRVIVAAYGAAPGAPVTLPAELVAAALETKEKKGPTPEDLQNLWNDLRDPRLPECIKLNSRRRRAAAARLKEFPEKKDWAEFIEVINKNKWLLGIKPSPGWPNWKANFDWFVKPTSIIKFKEGGFREAYEHKSARETYGDELDARSAAAREEIIDE